MHQTIIKFLMMTESILRPINFDVIRFQCMVDFNKFVELHDDFVVSLDPIRKLLTK